MVLDTLGLAPYVCPFKVGPKNVHGNAATSYDTEGFHCTSTVVTKVYAGPHCVRACLHGLGFDLPRDTRGNRILSSASARGHSPPAHGPDPLPSVAVEDWRTADCSTLAHVVCDWFSPSVHRKRGRLPGGTNCAFRRYGLVGGHGIVGDGSGGLAAAGRYAAGSARYGWIGSWGCRPGAVGGPKKPRPHPARLAARSGPLAFSGPSSADPGALLQAS